MIRLDVVHDDIVDALERHERADALEQLGHEGDLDGVDERGFLGTLDEVYDAAPLIQPSKIGPFPVVIMGSEYWAPIMEFMRTTMVSAGTISPEDLSYFLVTDSPEEAVRHILAAVTYRFGLRWEPRRRTRRRVWPSRDPARPG